MAERARGSDAVLLAAFETAYGTLPSAFGQLSFKSTDLSEEKTLGEDPLLGQGRDASDPYYEPGTDSGNFEIPLDLRGTGFWLKGLLGAPVTVDNGDGTFDHTYTSGGTLPSLSVEIGHPNLDTPKFFRHTGVKLGTLSFDMSRSGPVNAQVSAIAQDEEAAATTVDASPSTLALTRFNQGNGTIKLGGTTLAAVTQGSFSFDNSLEAVETIRADGKIDGVDEGEAKATGSMTVRYSTDTTIETAVDAEAPVSLEYSFIVPGAEGYKLVFALPRVFLPKPKKSISGPGGIEASYDWQAAKDASHMLQVTLTNDVAAY